MKAIVVGSFVQDHCWRTTRFPAPGESRIGQFSTFPGGKGFNQAIAITRQLDKPSDALFLGALGPDTLAQQAREFAQTNQLACVWIEKSVPTGAASIVVDAAGANLICVALGANEALCADDVNSAIDHFRSAQVVVAQLEVGLSATQAALRLARRFGALTVLNPAPMNPLVTADLIQLADILTPNETEFAFLLDQLANVRVHTADFSSDSRLHALCRQLSPATVVITLGSDGAFVSHADHLRRGDSASFYRTPASTVTVVDTTGAGDAFTGGLAAARLRFPNEPFAKWVQHASRVAGLSVESAGTALAMPSFGAVHARFGAII